MRALLILDTGRYTRTPFLRIMDVPWAVIPAAGRGTRMAGVTGGLPKELLPVRGSPLILHKIQSHLAAGVERICVVISPGKEAIREYLTGGPGPHPFGLERLNVETLGRCEIVYILQERPEGVAHAIWLAREVVGESPFVAAMPDTLIPGHTARLVQGFRAVKKDIVGLARVDHGSAAGFSNLGITDLPPDLRPGEVRPIETFSPRSEGPMTLGPGRAVLKLFGGGLFLPHYFDLIGEVRASNKEGELDDLPVIRLIMERFGLFGVVLDEGALDAGIPQGYEAAKKLWDTRGANRAAMIPEELTKPYPDTNFKPWELVRSEVALRKEIDNIPEEDEVWENLKWLVYNILQPIRERFGPIRVNSGYRCRELNRAVGGSDKSLHLLGCAADIEPLAEGVGLFELLEWAYENTPFLELIAEHFPGGWVHIAGTKEFAQTGQRGALKLKDRRHNYARLTIRELAGILGEGRRLA